MFRRQIQSAANEGRLVVPQMQVDSNPFSLHTIELQNPKVSIRPNQQKKNVIIDEPRFEQIKKATEKKSLEASPKSLTLRGQD